MYNLYQLRVKFLSELSPLSRLHYAFFFAQKLKSARSYQQTIFIGRDMIFLPPSAEVVVSAQMSGMTSLAEDFPNFIKENLTFSASSSSRSRLLSTFASLSIPDNNLYQMFWVLFHWNYLSCGLKYSQQGLIGFYEEWLLVPLQTKPWIIHTFFVTLIL